MDINRKSYNSIAHQWAEERRQGGLSKLVIDFASRITSGGHILDIGCGTGFPVAAYMAGQGLEVTGIDFAENLLQQAINAHYSKTKFLHTDFWSFSPDEKYDGIIAFDSFFHFDIKLQPEIYARVAGWMRPGAYLLFTHGASKGEITGSMYGQPFYYSCLDTSTVHALMQDAGLEVIYSVEKYRETQMDRDLVILGMKRD